MSNLQRHLRSTQPREHALISSNKRPLQDDAASLSTSGGFKAKQQQTLATSFKKSTDLEEGQDRYEEITNAVTYYVAKDGVPFNAAERPRFKHIMKVLERRYKVPAKSTFSRRAMKLYDSTRTSILDKLAKIESFSSTADMWSSHSLTPYMGFTIHWIDSDWDLKSRSLGTWYVPEDHTGDNIGCVMEDFLCHWELCVDKQLAITTDNGATKNIKSKD